MCEPANWTHLLQSADFKQSCFLTPLTTQCISCSVLFPLNLVLQSTISQQSRHYYCGKVGMPQLSRGLYAHCIVQITDMPSRSNASKTIGTDLLRYQLIYLSCSGLLFIDKFFGLLAQIFRYFLLHIHTVKKEQMSSRTAFGTLWCNFLQNKYRFKQR